MSLTIHNLQSYLVKLKEIRRRAWKLGGRGKRTGGAETSPLFAVRRYEGRNRQPTNGYQSQKRTRNCHP